MTFRPDFFDRDGDTLRCRVCLAKIPWAETDRDPQWLADHVGEAMGCPACGVPSRIPSEDETAWPDRKDPNDPMDGVPMTERPPSADPDDPRLA